MMNQQTQQQKEQILNFIALNVAFGMLVVAYVFSIKEIILEGLYHKIFLGVPVGFIFMIIISSVFAFTIYMFSVIDYHVYTQGLSYLEKKKKIKV